MRLSRTDWKYAVDTVMFLSLLGIVAIGLLMAFVIPEGPAELGRSKYVLGLHRHQWGDIHLVLSLAFSAFALVHILLAWSWIKGKAAAVFGRAWKAALVLTVLAALAIPGIFWLAASKNDPAFAEFGAGRGRGSMRSGELERPPQEPPPAACRTFRRFGKEKPPEPPPQARNRRRRSRRRATRSGP
jgi:small-conductance mechanosensitive channel